MPRSAAATARKAKWYHIVTLKTRVRRISYISVAADTAKTPAPATTGPIDGDSTGSLAGTLASLRHPSPRDRVIRRHVAEEIRDRAGRSSFRLTPTTCCAKKGPS